MEDYDLPDNDGVDFTLESFELPDNDQVNFTPVDEDVPDGFDVGVSPIDLPLGLDLPLRPLNLLSMEMGLAVFLVGFNGLLVGAAAFLRNYAAIIMWSFALFALLASGLFQIGLELYWAMIAATILLLMAGAVVQWMN